MPSVMKSYKYICIDPNGKRVKGSMEATNRMMCTRFLENKNMQVLSVTEYKNILTILGGISIGQTIKPAALIFYLKQLGSLLTSGIKLIDALEILAMQQENKSVRKILFIVQQEVFNGNKLSSAFEMFPNYFPGILVSMTEAGEVSGELGQTIVKCADHFEKQTKLNRQIKGAIRTPVIYFGLAIGVTVAMLLFIFPNISSMYDQFDGAKLPTITQIFLDLSDFFQAYWLPLFGGIAIFIFVFIMLKKISKSFQYALAKFTLRIPFIGSLIQMSNQIMISNTLAQLMSRSVNTIVALEVTKKVTKNQIYKDIIQDTINNVQDGKQFSKAFEESWAIDPIMSRMIATGEKTSEIPKLLMNLSKFYDEVSELKVAKIKSAITPILLLFVYALVGCLLVAIILPQISLGSQV